MYDSQHMSGITIFWISLFLCYSAWTADAHIGLLNAALYFKYSVHEWIILPEAVSVKFKSVQSVFLFFLKGCTETEKRLRRA